MGNFILQRYPALGFPMFRRYWLASFASVGATQLIILGQGWLIFQLSGSAFQLGVLGAAAAVPNILMTLAGGVIADRFDKRRILMCTSLIITVLLALLAWLDATDRVAVWHVLTIAALFSLISGLDWPVRVSLYPELVSRSAFMSAVALNSFIWQATRMALPAVGGLLIAATDTSVVFALGALGFFVMFAVISTIPIVKAQTAAGSAWDQVREGVSFIWHRQLFRWLILLTFVGMFFSQSINQIMPVFAHLLDAGETGFGYLLSAGGVGSVVGTLLIGGIRRYRRLGLLMLTGAGLGAVTVMIFAALATAGWFVAALLAMFVGALFASVFMISSMTVMQLSVPDRLRGRVMGIQTMGFSLMPLGGLLLGALVEQLGAAPAVWIGSGVYLTVILWVAARKRSVRDLDGRAVSDAHDGAQDQAGGDAAAAADAVNADAVNADAVTAAPGTRRP
ncbi:MAG: MFS transporter [Pseudomonadales bacterium]